MTKGKKQDSDENTNANDQQEENQDDTSDESSDNEDKDATITDVMDELKMEDAYIKQPSRFPDNTNVTPSIVKKTDSIYSIDYHTDSDEQIATFTGTLYTSSKEAKDEIQDFIDGKKSPSLRMRYKILDMA